MEEIQRVAQKARPHGKEAEGEAKVSRIRIERVPSTGMNPDTLRYTLFFINTTFFGAEAHCV